MEKIKRRSFYDTPQDNKRLLVTCAEKINEIIQHINENSSDLKEPPEEIKEKWQIPNSGELLDLVMNWRDAERGLSAGEAWDDIEEYIKGLISPPYRG
jgi:hypothetical protein